MHPFDLEPHRFGLFKVTNGNRFKIHVAGSKVIVDGQPRTGMVHCGLGRSTADWDGPLRTGTVHCGLGWSSNIGDFPWVVFRSLFLLIILASASYSIWFDLCFFASSNSNLKTIKCFWIINLFRCTLNFWVEGYSFKKLKFLRSHGFPRFPSEGAETEMIFESEIRPRDFKFLVMWSLERKLSNAWPQIGI